ncbi:MAG TPA: serine/threonine-protein kinase [Rhizobacter sp.]|nr:serine/threonine-protein kinase [Rhizobacter sp.]
MGTDLVGTLSLGALALLAAAAYIAWGLPRLRSRVGLAVSGLAACVGVSAAVLSMPSALAWAAGSAAIALAFGQLGFWLGGRGTARRVPAVGRAAPPSQSPSTAPVQQFLGRYAVEREVGRGAMGAVYVGRDPKIGRQVAIKTMALSKEFAGDELAEARQRFFREAETAGRLQHPDIVTIFDAGEDQGLAFIAMELLKGDNLETYAQPKNLLPVVTVLNTVARVADALGYAHSQGVVHRDVKPANVMVDLVADMVKVTDFGIARITDSSRTRTGMVLGTPSFMSPEQLAGRRVDGRSDLYSLGVMLFQLLTGRLPHRADSMAVLMQQIANEEAPDVRSLRPDLPPELARALASLLEKRPEARPASGQQLATELRRIALQIEASGRAPAAPPPSAEPPDSSGFAATVKMRRSDTGHNSGL